MGRGKNRGGDSGKLGRKEVIEVKKLSHVEWLELAEKAHLVVFGENRPKEMDRISYALLAVENGVVMSYTTVRETDAESVYFPYGGSFPGTKGVPGRALSTLIAFCDYFRDEGFKRVNFLVEGNNKPMLINAIKADFQFIGLRVFNGKPLLEMMKDLA